MLPMGLSKAIAECLPPPPAKESDPGGGGRVLGEGRPVRRPQVLQSTEFDNFFGKEVEWYIKSPYLQLVGKAAATTTTVERHGRTAHRRLREKAEGTVNLHCGRSKSNTGGGGGHKGGRGGGGGRR